MSSLLVSISSWGRSSDQSSLSVFPRNSSSEKNRSPPRNEKPIKIQTSEHTKKMRTLFFFLVVINETITCNDVGRLTVQAALSLAERRRLRVSELPLWFPTPDILPSSRRWIFSSRSLSSLTAMFSLSLWNTHIRGDPNFTESVHVRPRVDDVTWGMKRSRE